jgi:hypothetical protein
MAKGSSLPLCSETSCLTYLWRLPSEWIVLGVVFLPRFVTGTTDVQSLISHGENSIVSVSGSLHTHVSYRLDRKNAYSGRKQDSNTYVRHSQAVSGTVREMLLPISAGTQIILTLVDLQLDAQNSYLLTYNTFLKSSTCFEHYPAHLQEVYVVIVYMQHLVSSLSAGNCLVHRLRKDEWRYQRLHIYNYDVDLLKVSRKCPKNVEDFNKCIVCK